MFKKMVACLLLMVPLLAEEGIIVLSSEQIADAGITTELAKPQRLRMTVASPAKVIINQEKQAHVVAMASGIVTKILKGVGDRVKKGEFLAILESKEVAEAKGDYITALKREELAAQKLAAEEALKDKKISSEQDYLNALLAAKEAKINLEVALQKLYILGMNDIEIQPLERDELKFLRQYAIKAPIDGIVIMKDLSRGAQIAADQEIYTIADLDTVWLELGVYPEDLPKVKQGSKLFVSTLKGDTPAAEATLAWISPTIDEESKRAVGIGQLTNKEQHFCPGSYVRVDIVVDEQEVPQAVLREAVQEIDGDSFLFVPHAQGFEKRAVELGKTDGKWVEIISGIRAGEPYAATQTFLLKADLGKAEAEL